VFDFPHILNERPTTAMISTLSPHTLRRQQSTLKALTSRYPFPTVTSTAALRRPSSRANLGARTPRNSLQETTTTSARSILGRKHSSTLSAAPALVALASISIITKASQHSSSQEAPAGTSYHETSKSRKAHRSQSPITGYFLTLSAATPSPSPSPRASRH
jgi:hypothetical protein